LGEWGANDANADRYFVYLCDRERTGGIFRIWWVCGISLLWRRGKGAAEIDFDTEGVGEGGFGPEAFIGGLSVLGVGDLDVVGLVLGHELVAGDAVGDSVHDGPFFGGGFKAAAGFFFGEFEGGAASDVHVELFVLDVDAGPDDFAGLGNSVDGGAAVGKVDVGLAVAVGPFPAACEVGGRGGSADKEDPDELVVVFFSPADVVEGVFGRLTECVVDAVSEEGVKAGAFVDFVEVGERLALVEDAGAIAGGDGWAVRVVEHAFGEVAGGEEVVEALLVLDADGVAAEVIGEAHGGDIHFALKVDLSVGELGLGIASGVKGHAFALEPVADGLRFGVGDLVGFVEEGGLAEAFFENTAGVEGVIGNDGVEHAHATFVEDAHDGFVSFEGLSEFLTDIAG